MAESRHRTGSAILFIRGRKGRAKKSTKCRNKKEESIREDSFKERYSNKKIILILCVIIFAFLCFMGGLAVYAKYNNRLNVFWECIAAWQQSFVSCGLLGSITPFVLGKKTQNKFVLNFYFLFIGVILVLMCGSVFAKIQGDIERERETTENQETNHIEVEIAMQSGEGLQDFKRNVLVYDINQDLYMDSRPLEDYYAGDITEENECAVRADILLINLDKNVPTGSKSENYNSLLETADKEYDTYLYQRNRDKGSEAENDALFSDRIEMLQKSLDKREEAHKECEYPENERPLANGYKDIGDEYFKRGRQNDAMIAYEESAGWYMKAIYHAAALHDKDEMMKSMNLMKKMGKEAERLNEIDSGRKEKISLQVKVYTIFVEKINEGLE